MIEPTAEDDLLATYANDSGDDRWWFTDRATTYSRADALAIIGACQALGVPVTDVVTPQAFAVLVQRVVG